jgi:hypothetical protein
VAVAALRRWRTAPSEHAPANYEREFAVEAVRQQRRELTFDLK